MGEVVVNALDGHHGLLVAVKHQRVILYALGGNVHFGQLLYLCEHGIVGWCVLSFGWHHLDLWVEGGEERGNEVVKAVEHAQHDNQGHRCNSHAHHRDGTNDIDGIGAFLGEKVAAGDEKRYGHERLFF